MNVCVSLKFICWNLLPNLMALGGGALGGHLGPKGGAHMMELLRYKRDPTIKDLNILKTIKILERT